MTPLETITLRIADLGACQAALKWLEELDPSTTVQQAWDSCSRPDWMFWLLGRIKEPNKVAIVRVACTIARTVLKHVPEGELRPLRAIEAAEAWAENPNKETAHSAYAAAHSASAAADAAADAARGAAYSAYAAADAASAASAAAYAAACGIIRQHFPNPPEL